MYPWQQTVDYHNNEEYQEQLASVMRINVLNDHLSVMDDLYTHTKDDEPIRDLCILAAKKCLSTPDAEYGQIMMFSYDCFFRFHRYLQWYFGKDKEKEAREDYAWLKTYFSQPLLSG
jgi:hypothetical protein